MAAEKDTRNIHQRLAAAMLDVTYIQKDKKQGMRYSIVSHDVVTAKVRPALLKQGIVYYPFTIQYNQNGNRTEVNLDVRFTNIDDPNDFFVVPGLGYGIDDQDKGPGKAISYAVKYALLKALGLETGDDPDQDQDIELREGLVEELLAALDMATNADDLDRIRDEVVMPRLGQLTAVSKSMLKTAYSKKSLTFAKA